MEMIKVQTIEDLKKEYDRMKTKYPHVSEIYNGGSSIWSFRVYLPRPNEPEKAGNTKYFFYCVLY